MNSKETRLEQQLSLLRARLLVMCASVGIAVDEACEALSGGNIGKASAVVDGDEGINALENEIDDIALSILARNQPVAQDLRAVAVALRMVVDLERIGDEAASIAERVLILHEALPQPLIEAVSPLMHSARSQYARAAEAFRTQDKKRALELCRTDDDSTQEEVAALQRIMNYLHPEADTDGMPSYASMHAILICRALNRICRRAMNIAEQTYFMLEGVNIKHIPLDARLAARLPDKAHGSERQPNKE